MPIDLRGPDAAFAFFHAEVPDTVLAGIADCVIGGYRHAREQLMASGLGSCQLHDVAATFRRSHIEANLEQLHQFLPYVTARVEQNKAANSFHVEVACNRVVITCSKVDSPACAIPDAEYRRTLARSCQLSLWETEEPTDAVEPLLWSVVIHGASEWLASAPDFLHVVFPLEDGTYYRSIDLYRRLPQLRAIPVQTEVEDIPAEADVRLRPTARMSRNNEGS